MKDRKSKRGRFRQEVWALLGLYSEERLRAKTLPSWISDKWAWIGFPQREYLKNGNTKHMTWYGWFKIIVWRSKKFFFIFHIICINIYVQTEMKLCSSCLNKLATISQHTRGSDPNRHAHSPGSVYVGSAMSMCEFFWPQTPTYEKCHDTKHMQCICCTAHLQCMLFIWIWTLNACCDLYRIAVLT